MTKMAFVAGATGYTGREVVRCLVEAGVEVRAHIRPDSPRRTEWEAYFQRMGAIPDKTVWEASSMKETLSLFAPDFIFALLGTTKARMKKEKNTDYETVDYGLTHLLLQASLGLKDKPKFIYLSSIGVGPKSRGDYLKVRWRMEEEVRHAGLPYIIARPSFITGADRDEDRPLERYGSSVVDGILKMGKMMGLPKLQARYASTTNSILAKALVHAAMASYLKDQTLESESLR